RYGENQGIAWLGRDRKSPQLTVADRRLLLLCNPPKRRCRNVQAPPFGLDRPRDRKAAFHDCRFGEGFGIVHQRRKVSTAGNQPGHVELVVPAVAGKTDRENALAGWPDLDHSRQVVTHANHLWNSSHIATFNERSLTRVLTPADRRGSF